MHCKFKTNKATIFIAGHRLFSILFKGVNKYDQMIKLPTAKTVESPGQNTTYFEGVNVK